MKKQGLLQMNKSKNTVFLCRIGVFSVLFLLAFSLTSCRSGDPMDPYRNLGAPDGMKDTYPDVRKKKQKKEKSFFQKMFEEERENKRRFRDVSRPMPQGTVEVFPWKGDNRRSQELYDNIRREKKNMN